MNPGELNKLVMMQSPTKPGTRDAVGQRATTFVDVVEVWAKVQPVSSAERHAAAQAQMETTHRVTIRGGHQALTGLDGSWRILFGDRPLVISGIRDIDERGVWIEITCSEGLKEE